MVRNALTELVLQIILIVTPVPRALKLPVARLLKFRPEHPLRFVLVALHQAPATLVVLKLVKNRDTDMPATIPVMSERGLRVTENTKSVIVHPVINGCRHTPARVNRLARFPTKPVQTRVTMAEVHAAAGADTLSKDVPANMAKWARAVMLPVMWVREAAMLNLGDDAVINAAAPEHNPRISEKYPGQ